MDQVDYVNGRTRLFAIIGDPIAQVRSPEMVTWEMRSRGMDAVLVPMHVRADEFDEVLPRLMRLANLDGLIFTIPFKQRACALAGSLGVQARATGAINALARRADGTWDGEMFDGLGCVEAFRRRGWALAGRRVALLGLGGAGGAIACAVAGENPALLRVFDLDPARRQAAAERVRRVNAALVLETAPIGDLAGFDVLLNATPVGMLGDTRMPIEASQLRPGLIVFDAVVMPERTPLIQLAESIGCPTVLGREMMRGQISRIVDFFLGAAAAQDG